MADIIGSIGPTVEITESEAFDAPTRTVNVTDAAGRLHGRVQWLAAETGEGFEQGLLALFMEATASPSPVVSSSSGSGGTGA